MLFRSHEITPSEVPLDLPRQFAHASVKLGAADEDALDFLAQPGRRTAHERERRGLLHGAGLPAGFGDTGGVGLVATGGALSALRVQSAKPSRNSAMAMAAVVT